MIHIDEHTLELYILGTGRVQVEKDMIESHLAQCDGCRALADELRALYGDFEKKLSLHDQNSGQEQVGLVRRHQRMTNLRDSRNVLDKISIHPQHKNPLQRVYETARRHPGRTTFASLAMLGMIFAMFNLTVKHFFPAGNPTYMRYNLTQNTIEIYGQNDEKLWELATDTPLAGLKNDDDARGTQSVQIEDLDGDGKNEVITRLAIGKKRPRWGMSVYAADKTLIREIQAPERILNYKTNHYEAAYFFGNFVIGNFGAGGKKEIVAVLTNGRSPSIIARFDTEGTLKGEYNHYGSLASIYAADVNHDGRLKIILTGQNDIFEYQREWLPVIVVLDPEKITGQTESLVTPGFGFTPSSAEMYYIQLPDNDVTQALHIFMGIQRLAITDTVNQLRFATWSTERDDRQPGFEFIFSHSMNILDVKSGNQTIRLHETLAFEGKVSGAVDDAYLQALRNRVVNHVFNGRRTQSVFK